MQKKQRRSRRRVGPGSGVVVVTTTTDRKPRALALARKIVEGRLAACVQVVPIHSLYRWKGRVESAREFLLTAKTRTDRAEALVSFIRCHHSYELPEILVTPVLSGLEPYVDWIRTEAGGGV
jgi:periplasmic divalent cation tolerance protein